MTSERTSGASMTETTRPGARTRPGAAEPVAPLAGTVEAIHTAPASGAPMVAHRAIRAIEGRGLEGDRYALGTGHWSPIRRAGDSLTLVESETIERLWHEHGIDLGPGDTRRNVTTRGIRLDTLIGRRFRLGAATCEGVRRCEPCTWLEGILGKEVLYPLVHCGGIRVRVLQGGVVAVGDRIEALDPPATPIASAVAMTSAT